MATIQKRIVREKRTAAVENLQTLIVYQCIDQIQQIQFIPRKKKTTKRQKARERKTRQKRCI